MEHEVVQIYDFCHAREFGKILASIRSRVCAFYMWVDKILSSLMKCAITVEMK
jgi:hypothetical protein